MNGYKRNSADKLKALLALFPAVIIIGARQSGKTTLAQSVFSDWKYIDLENFDDYQRIHSDPSFFFSQYPDSLIIDEAQTYPELFNTLRGVIDAKRHQKGRFILTGSASPHLQKLVSETLAGRVAIMELGNFKTNEFIGAPLSPFYKIFEQRLDKKNILLPKAPISSEAIHYTWLHGGYPEPLLSQNEQFVHLWMDNYQKTYIDRDIAKLFPKLNTIAYQRFLAILSKLSGTIINKSDIARAIEINEKTIREYLSIASGTSLWKNLPSFEKNIVKAIIKMPKGYLRDTGLLHYLLKITTMEDLYEHPIVGNSFESFVIEEILKGLSSTFVTNWSPYYYRTRNGAEIDLILEGPFGILPVEIKYGIKINLKQIKTLTAFVKEHQLAYGILINQAQHVEWVNEHVIQIPVGYL